MNNIVFDNSFLGSCIVEYRNTGCLLIQTVIESRLRKDHGDGWLDYFNSCVRERADRITDGENPYIKIVRTPFSKLDVTYARRVAVDLEIVKEEEEINAVENLRICRNLRIT